MRKKIRYCLHDIVSILLYDVPILRKSYVHKYSVSYIGKYSRILWAHVQTGAFISDPSIPGVTPTRLPRQYRELRASLGRLDFLCLVKQTAMTDSTGRGTVYRESYQVISLSSAPCLGNNYRRTASRNVFLRFSAIRRMYLSSCRY